ADRRHAEVAETNQTVIVSPRSMLMTLYLGGISAMFTSKRLRVFVFAAAGGSALMFFLTFLLPQRLAMRSGEGFLTIPVPERLGSQQWGWFASNKTAEAIKCLFYRDDPAAVEPLF